MMKTRFRKILSAILSLFLLLGGINISGLKTKAANVPEIRYCGHVQNIGWQAAAKNGGTAGTTGKGLRLEGIKIDLKKNSKSMIQYRTHVENIGWQSWKNSGEISGTTGKGLRVEGIQIRLTGEYAKLYDVYYRVHVPQYGWLGYAMNGKTAGSTGIALRVEAVQIKLVHKTQKLITSGNSEIVKPILMYQAHSQNLGWMGAVAENSIAGSVGKSYRLEALKISLQGGNVKGGLSYKAHVADIGWQGYKTTGQIMGTTGQGKAIEAVQIQLTGELATGFDIYYRMHVAGLGWLGWAKNGEMAGTTGGGIRSEAIQIQMIAKSVSFQTGGVAYFNKAGTINELGGDSFSSLKKKYPNGSYWNGNYRNKAWQCHGFALTLGYERTGTDPYGWKKVYNFNSLKAGDIIVCKKPHTIMVTNVSGNTVTYVDCNWVGKNKVAWNQSIQKEKITSKFGTLKYVLVSPK